MPGEHACGAGRLVSREFGFWVFRLELGFGLDTGRTSRDGGWEQVGSGRGCIFLKFATHWVTVSARARLQLARAMCDRCPLLPGRIPPRPPSLPKQHAWQSRRILRGRSRDRAPPPPNGPY